MISYIGIFAVSYVTVQVVTFTECDPFSHYWLVFPQDPGVCCQAQLQLIVLGMSPFGNSRQFYAKCLRRAEYHYRSDADRLADSDTSYGQAIYH